MTITLDPPMLEFIGGVLGFALGVWLVVRWLVWVERGRD